METTNQTMQTVNPGRVRVGTWLSQGWDWFLEDPGPYLLVGLLAVALISFSGGILWGPVLVGLAATGVRRARLKRTEAADFFEGATLFLPGFLAGILVICFTIAGLIFLIVPGVVIFSMYLFAFHFIFDKKQDFWEAMESSRRLVSQDLFGFAIFSLLLAALNFLGVLFFGVGCVLTSAVTSLAVTAAYLDCTEGVQEAAPAAERKPVTID